MINTWGNNGNSDRLYFGGLQNHCNCEVVWAFFGIAFLGIGMKKDLFQSCGHWWVFQISWHIECSTFTASSFRIWNSSTPGYTAEKVNNTAEKSSQQHYLQRPKYGSNRSEHRQWIKKIYIYLLHTNSQDSPAESVVFGGNLLAMQIPGPHLKTSWVGGWPTNRCCKWYWCLDAFAWTSGYLWSDLAWPRGLRTDKPYTPVGLQCGCGRRKSSWANQASSLWRLQGKYRHPGC